MVVAGPGGTIAHAELRLGRGVLMLGSVKDDPYGTSPRRLGGVSHSLYVGGIEQVDAHCERARTAGAEIVREPADTDYGSRDYSCRDLEGHVWTFGRYLPDGA